ncbi:hypothetical protein [Caballeronia sp. Lep1P3]|uniref:hypothetical protein n=1 Tax=Caballeronia sp. Lep1P3 TaxID=2878150 RepID=UPI001FD58509|nr:hypothetical protein [Caballeronia sp. Lep1P3]
MNANPNPKLVAMMAACALVASIGTARAQGMPDAAQQLVQTMRPTQPMPPMEPMEPMQADRDAPAPQTAQSSDETAYGGAKAGTSMSASGRAPDACRNQPRCEVFFGH